MDRRKSTEAILMIEKVKHKTPRPYKKDGETKVRCQVTIHTKDRALLLRIGEGNLSGGIGVACNEWRDVNYSRDAQ
jgi:hypothetical protein